MEPIETLAYFVITATFLLWPMHLVLSKIGYKKTIPNLVKKILKNFFDLVIVLLKTFFKGLFHLIKFSWNSFLRGWRGTSHL